MFDKILIVEDDPITQLIYKKVFEKTTFAKAIVIVQNGEEALAYFENSLKNNDPTPNMVFMDLNMPVMDGWSFLDEFTKEKFKDISKDINFIVLSSTIDPRDIEKSKTFTIVKEFLPKPVNKELLEFLKEKYK